MLIKDYNYNTNEDLDHCPLCQKSFIEGEPVSIINPSKGPFLIVHTKCYKKIVLNKKVAIDKENLLKDNLLKVNDKLWRYMDLAKFISMMKSSALYFLSPECFEDIYEGAHGELRNKQLWDNFYMSYARTAIITAPDNCWHKIGKESLEKNARMIIDQISHPWNHGVFINCWYHSEFESEAMWKMYSVNVKNAIAIQTTYGILKKQMQEATINPIRYIDYSNQFVGPNEEYWCKRKSFEYENEVRAIIYDFDSKDCLGITKVVDLSILIENVYISPYAPNWFQDIVIDLITRYGYTFNVNRSSLAEVPF